MTKERILVRKESIDLDVIFGDTDLDSMMAGAQKLHDKYYKLAFEKGQFIEFSCEWAGYDGGHEVVANIYRWETDAEYHTRLDEEAARERAKQQRQEAKKAKALARALETEAEERALYEKLKEKFGA